MPKKCLEVLKRCQSVDARLEYGFEWTREFSRRWVRDHPFDLGIVIRPETIPTGYEYVSSGGQTGAEEPLFKLTIGSTTRDGSLVWTAQDVSSNSLMDSIASDTWTVSSPSGLTVEPVTPIITSGMQLTSVILSGGVVGVTYTVENEVFTTLGFEYVARIVLEIE